MKKIYMTPSTMTVQVEMQSLMEISGVKFETNGTGEIQTLEDDATGEAMGRSSSWWSDDE